MIFKTFLFFSSFPFLSEITPYLFGVFCLVDFLTIFFKKTLHQQLWTAQHMRQEQIDHSCDTRW